MKLIRLQLNSPFRSLQAGFTINFRKGDQLDGFSPFCLVGRNGVGKSNVMEALAAIFYHLECIYLETPNALFEAVEERPDIPYFDSAKSYPDAYELIYRIKVTGKSHIPDGQYLVRITKFSNERPIIDYQKYSNEPMAGKVADADGVDRTEARALLPDLVIGYSSGENEILSLPFFRMRFVNYDEYKYRTAQGFDFNYREPEGRMFYCDAQFSQTVMLVNYLMQEKSVLSPFKDDLGITGVERFRLVIRRQQPVTLPSHHRGNKSDEQHTLQPDIEKMIELLKKCATLWHETQEPWISLQEEPSTPTLYLDFWVNDATRKAFQLHFENSPMVLMRTFQTLFALNLYDITDEDKREIYHREDLYAVDVAPKLLRHKKVIVIEDLFIKKQGVKEPIPLKSLSDGEHQFLHAIGLSILSRQDNVLFLLDEPETHFNPGWRAKFISTLRNCLIGEGQSDQFVESEYLITSHSPFIVSDCKPEHVFVFNKKDGKVSCSNPTFNTFGTSVNILTEEIFEKKESISDIALEQLEELKNRPMESLEEIQQIKEESRELGESVEKVLLFRQLILKEEELKRQKDA